MPFYHRWARSLGELEGTAEEAWGTQVYDSVLHRKEPCVFFGFYDLRDYWYLWRHQGKRYILWCGGDIRNLVNKFIFNDGKLRILSKIFRGNWWLIPLLKKCENYVENQEEEKELARLGIESTIVPSFLGKKENFPLCYKWKPRPNVYVSANPGREEEYGFDYIENIAKFVPECVFHLYGAPWKTNRENVICHGRVPKEQFNKEIKEYQCGLRLNEHDGFSEITAKSVLMGQYPITRIEFPMIDNFTNDYILTMMLKNLKNNKEPNIAARNYYLENINKFPWTNSTE